MSVEVRLKHSSVQDKEPLPADLANGELALNINANSPGAFIKDSAGNIVKIAGAGAIGGTPATETAAGIAELATQTETNTGTDDERIVTPLKLQNKLNATVVPATETAAGIAEIATQAEADAGTDDSRMVTPLKMATYVATFAPVPPAASEAAPGIAELATQAETDAGTDDERIVTPLKLATKLSTAGTGATGNFGYWNRTGTVVSPTNAGDAITTTGDVNGAGGTFTADVTVGGNTTLSAAGAITTPAVTLDPGTTGSPLVRDSLGRLLIGTSSAFGGQWDSLQIQSNVLPGLAFARNEAVITESNPLGVISFYGNDGGTYELCGKIECTADASHAASSKPSRLVFSSTPSGSATPVERMRISNNGAINTFVSNVTGFTVRNNAPGGTTIANIECARDATNTSDGTVNFRVWTNGNVENQNNSYGPISSDERLKQDINDANSQWDDIKNIRITNFHYKNDPAGPLHLGPIAQELEQVSPGLITRRPASEDEIADPSNGLVDGDEVLSFKASVLYMKAVKALQEAMERIETLEAKVAALETP